MEMFTKNIISGDCVKLRLDESEERGSRFFFIIFLTVFPIYFSLDKNENK